MLHGGRAINGVFTAVIGVSSFVVTLGMLFTFEGLALIISHGTPVSTPGAEVHQVTRTRPRRPTVTISTFAKIFGGGTYSELIWALVIVVILQIALTFSRWGLYTVAIGSNKLGAAEAGVPVKLVTMRNFVLCASTAGLVGILEAVRSSSIQPDPAGANEILLLAIASAGHRRHAAGRGLGDGGRRADRRAVPRDPQGRPDPAGRQRRTTCCSTPALRSSSR